MVVRRRVVYAFLSSALTDGISILPAIYVATIASQQLCRVIYEVSKTISLRKLKQLR